MNVKDLIAWVVLAIDIREESWHKDAACYTKTVRDALIECKPKNASDIELDIATSMYYGHIDQVQDWHRAFLLQYC